MTAESPRRIILDVAALAGFSPEHLKAQMTKLRRYAAEGGVDVEFAVDMTSPPEIATLELILGVWPDVLVLECAGP
jgi:hypothetical protein